MDCLFNQYIPLSAGPKIIIKPCGQTFINGLASSYDEEFPIQLQGYIEENTYKKCIVDLNEILINYWPCLCARAIGYLCCLCSFGASLLMPNVCISDAEEAFRRRLDYYNDEYFKNKGFNIKLYKKCSTSWLEITIIKDIKNSMKNPLDDTGNESI